MILSRQPGLCGSTIVEYVIANDQLIPFVLIVCEENKNYTVRWSYNTANFLQNPNNRHSKIWASFVDSESDLCSHVVNAVFYVFPDSKVHEANMGPIWGRQDPGGPHIGPMNFVIWDYHDILDLVTQR